MFVWRHEGLFAVNAANPLLAPRQKLVISDAQTLKGGVTDHLPHSI